MAELPHVLTALLIAFNDKDEVLMLERVREPNQGFWSPPGGKVMTSIGESPYACAIREAREEIGLELKTSDLHLAGMVAEQSYENRRHFLMFVFEIRPRLVELPPPNPEGRFAFVEKANLDRLKIPNTDRQLIWPLFWKHRGGFFSVSCDCSDPDQLKWHVEETRDSAMGGRVVPGPQ